MLARAQCSTARMDLLVSCMGKRRSDADTRRFFDEFEMVRVSRFRALGVIDPAKRHALIPMGGKDRLIATSHVWFPNGGGWSYFLCPKCARRKRNLYLVEDAPRCSRCCEALNIQHRCAYGFGRAARLEASDKRLDQLIAKLESTQRLMLKPHPKSWTGKRQIIYNSRRLTARMQRRKVALRLNQLASQQAKDTGGLKITKAYKPRTEALIAIPDLSQIWRARTSEALQQALDKAQIHILNALESDDPQTRLNAAKLMMRTKQARQRGLR